LDAAETHYRKLLKLLPSNITLLSNLGAIAFQKGHLEEALKIIARSLQCNPNQPYALNNLGSILKDLKRLDEALENYDRAIALEPDFALAYSNRGNALQELEHLEAALDSYEQAIALNPDYADAYCNHGAALQKLNRLHEALDSYERAITLKPDYAEAYYNRGAALQKLKRQHEALDSYDRAIALNPDYADAYCSRGATLQELQRLDDALANYDNAITLNPDHVDAYCNRGSALQKLKRQHEALDSYDRAIALNPDYADAYCSRGTALQELQRLDEALASYDTAITLNPDHVDAYYNSGVALQELKRFDEALASYEQVIALKPDMDFVLGYALSIKMQLCIWDDLPNHLNELTYKISNNEKVAVPFTVLALIDDPEIQRKTAEIFVYEKYPVSDVLPKIQRYPQHAKLRIGYFSADFRNHPVAHLTAELYETHDRTNFEIYAFYFGPETNDEMNLRIIAGVDYFHDVRTLSDKDIVLLARSFEIDIAVDLGGYTAHARTEIFAMQAAPIQVNYLGYPGTMAAVYIDYLIADRTVISDHQQQYYSEKIVYLPNTYMVNDTKNKISERIFTREETGLPTHGFVFCCFNNHYKITPTIFIVWMRILLKVEGSVLWLSEGNNTAVDNLKKEAVKMGVNDDRLIFAPRLTFMEDHFKRLQLADLFLDTLPFNAHTTASDALRMGLPVLTCIGQSFTSRVAASLLNAVNLPELITSTQEQYEALAIELATHPEKLKTIKAKLVANLATEPLYDTPLFTKHLESAYLTMYDRDQNGLAPEHIYVEH